MERFVDEVSRMISEGSPVGVTKDQVSNIRNSRFPEVVGRTTSTFEVPDVTSPKEMGMNPVDFTSLSRMIAGE